MSKWFPKNLLQWREPRALVRWRLDEELRTWSRRSRLLYALLAPLMLLPPWLILWELDDPKALPPTVAVPASLGLGLALVYGMPLLLRVFPSFVRIMEHGIVRSSHGTSWLTYDRIEQCSLGTKEIDGERICTLTVTPKKGKEFILGIEAGVSPARVLELLREKGVRLGAEAGA